MGILLISILVVNQSINIINQSENLVNDFKSIILHNVMMYRKITTDLTDESICGSIGMLLVSQLHKNYNAKKQVNWTSNWSVDMAANGLLICYTAI